MKNKHLVFLFLAVIVVGFMSRRIPWHWREDVHANLLHLDTARISQVAMQAPGHPELLLERTEAGWAITEGARGVMISAEQAAQWMAALQGLHSLRVVDGRRDTLGLTPEQGIRVTVRSGEKVVEECWLGYETTVGGQPATYVLLPKHEGVYAAAGRWRGLFSHVFEDFRENKLLTFEHRSLRALAVEWPDTPSVFLAKNDSTQRWASPDGLLSTTDDSLQTWLRLFDRLHGCPFADYFDESRARETLHARFRLLTAARDTLTLSIFYLRPPDLPEDPAALPPPKAFSSYVLHSSQNPLNYFALVDTVLAGLLCRGMLPDQAANRN